jgi:hypothetical protein
MLNVARKADREAMAKAIEVLAVELGVECKRDEIMTQGREIHLRLKLPGGLECGLELDGDSGQNQEGTFCMPWCVWGSDAQLSEAFGAAMRSSVNPYHRRKCTAFAYGWDDFLAKLRVGITMTTNGEAYDVG